MYLLGGPTILMAPIGHLDIPLHVGKGPMDQLSIKKGTRHGSKISNSQNGFIQCTGTSFHTKHILGLPRPPHSSV